VKALNPGSICVFWNFLETAWRRMNYRQAAHVVAPSFWVFVWSAWRPGVTRQALLSLLLFLSRFNVLSMMLR